MQRVMCLVLFFCPYLAFAADTILKLYRPFGEVTEQVPLLVKESIAGECLGPSQLMLREDAWHCEAKGIAYDPCFVNPMGNKAEAICPQSPWLGDSVKIVSNRSFNPVDHPSLDMSTTFPWAIELANGERCQAMVSEQIVDGLSVHYRCHDNNVLIGNIQRCKATWHILEKTNQGIQLMALQRVWF